MANEPDLLRYLTELVMGPWPRYPDSSNAAEQRARALGGITARDPLLLRAVTESCEAVWLMSNLDRSLSSSFLNAADYLLDEMVHKPGQGTIGLPHFSATENEMRTIHENLHTIQIAALKLDFLYATRVAQVWASHIRANVRGPMAKPEASAPDGRVP